MLAEIVISQQSEYQMHITLCLCRNTLVQQFNTHQIRRKTSRGLLILQVILKIQEITNFNNTAQRATRRHFYLDYLILKLEH